MKQNFIICLEAADGRQITFERWPFKRVQTCVAHMVELYKTYSGLYGRYLDQAAKVVAYHTPDGYNRAAPVWSVSVDEFRKLMSDKEDQ